MKIGICSVGSGEKYPMGATRLKDSLVKHGNTWEKYIWINELPPGSPSHQEQPYAFKIHAMKYAMQQGCDIIIWADSAVWAISNKVEPLIEYIDKMGYYFTDGGYSIGQWTSDVCLQQIGITRDDRLHDRNISKMIMACFYAIDLRKPNMVDFYNEVIDWSLKDNGLLLRGDWKNDRKQVSLDSRCSGHRHDQSIISLLIKKYGFEIVNGYETFFQYYPILGRYIGNTWKTDTDYVGKIKDSVCFLSQGT